MREDDHVGQRATTEVHSGHRRKVTGPLHGLQIAVPRWSPDGKQIAFIGGLMSDQGSTGGDIYLIPATGRRAEKYHAGACGLGGVYRDGSVRQIIGIAEHVGGSSHLRRST